MSFPGAMEPVSSIRVPICKGMRLEWEDVERREGDGGRGRQMDDKEHTYQTRVQTEADIPLALLAFGGNGVGEDGNAAASDELGTVSLNRGKM